MIVPSLVNIVINLLTLAFVRSSARRVHIDAFSAFTNVTVSGNRKRISRREMALLRQMAMTFVIFIGGWSPIYIVTILGSVGYVHPLIYQTMILVCQIAVLSILFNLIKINRDLREFIVKKLRLCSSNS
jgi:hypothetical protein